MSNDKEKLYRKIPSVDRLLLNPKIEELLPVYPRSVVLKSIHEILDELRREIQSGELADNSTIDIENVLIQVKERLNKISQPSLKRVINATGIVVHTNLGRSNMADKVLRRLKEIGGFYSNLEYDLAQGKRGSRYVHVEEILKELTSAEAAMVVNNNAAAVLICLDTLAKGREVIVSRGQLVEIGGSFRIPDVMRRSGAKMVEVGTTNKTHLNDYEEMIGEETALLLKVHTSNFQIVGFTEEVPLNDLAKLGKRYNIPIMEDLGSGCIFDLSKYIYNKEPTVQESLLQGADLVTFSGDKLLGGPQAGIILGRKDLIDAIKENQLTRALRIDKLTLLALEETLRLYREENKAVKDIPTLRMICQSYRSLKMKAERLIRLAGNIKCLNYSIELRDGNSKVGGGALPLLELPSCLISLIPEKLSSKFMETWLRTYDPPVIARLEKDKVIIDVRTVQESDLKILSKALRDLAFL
ncbi:MAG TPA: L-seryl-tRNA(Sec) selenium transferase [Desulfobacteraceae bacterium]|nr:L-seryl-tRNA(Sec) selenium transferase [Desulfobacteraceae bacterium]HPJ66937.1 L-seryl-tRNA(Sec) selenium transferase [Desulfobacteraceae bacterium]HPQ27671.1 L-seryl-tRNA(Sec) selenium transferase [Desulfobacteraceae bacterium]